MQRVSPQSLFSGQNQVVVTAATPLPVYAALLTNYDRRFKTDPNSPVLEELRLESPTATQMELLNDVVVFLRLKQLWINSDLVLENYENVLLYPEQLWLEADFQLTRQLGVLLRESCARQIVVNKRLAFQSEVNALRIQTLSDLLISGNTGGFVFEPWTLATGPCQGAFCDEFCEQLAQNRRASIVVMRGFPVTKIPTCASNQLKEISFPLLVIQNAQEAFAQLRDVLTSTKATELSIQNLGSFSKEIELAMSKSEALRSDVFVPVDVVQQ